MLGVPRLPQRLLAAARGADHRSLRPVRPATTLGPAPAPAATCVGLGFVVCLLLSVLLHELGHALTARRYGIGVTGITLELLGGYTEMDRDAPTPAGRPAGLAGRAGRLRWCSASSPRSADARAARPDRARPARLPAGAAATSSWPSSTRCPACRWTAAGRCGPWSGRSAATGTSAPRWPAGSGRVVAVATGWPPSSLLRGRRLIAPVRPGLHAAGRAHPVAGRRPGDPARPGSAAGSRWSTCARLARPVFAVPSRHPAGRGAAARRRGRPRRRRAGRGRRRRARWSRWSTGRRPTPCRSSGGRGCRVDDGRPRGSTACRPSPVGT